MPPFLDSAPRSPRTRSFDVAIVGAGPAGALAARESARAGFSTLLIDRAQFPRRKICGGCLHPEAHAALEQVGLGSLPAELGAVPLKHTAIAVRGKSVRVPAERASILSRERFDHALVEQAAESGVELALGSFARLARLSDSAQGRVLELRPVGPRLPSSDVAAGEERIEAALVLAADGLGSSLLADAGETVHEARRSARVGVGCLLDWAPQDVPPGEAWLALGRQGFVGLTRLEDDRLDVAAAVDALELARHGATKVCAAILRSAGRQVPRGLDSVVWRGTPGLSRRARGFGANRLGAARVFAIGDAAGCVEPFVGEGLGRALSSALLVQPLIRRAVAGWTDELGEAWADLHGQHFNSSQRNSGGVARLVRHPRLLSAAIGSLGSSRLARTALARAGLMRSDTQVAPLEKVATS